MSTVRVKRHVEYSLEIDGRAFDVGFEPIDGTAIVEIAKGGRTATVRYLVQDESARDNYFEEQDSGEFYCADPRSLWYRAMGAEEIEQLFRDHPGRVFFVNKYEHGLVRYYRDGKAREAGVYSFPFDTSSHYAIYVAPEDATDPEKCCDAVMCELSDWCNGSIYGCVRETHKRIKGGAWERVESDECWGYIGMAYAEETLKTF